VSIIAAFQSRAQVVARWGETGASVILNNSGSVMVFGGTKDRDDLAYWSALAGECDEPVVSTNDHGKVTSRTVRKVAVFAPAQLANLPAGKVVVFRRGMPPAVGRVAMAWNRRDVRTHAKLARRETAGVVAAAEDAARAATQVATWVDDPRPVPGDTGDWAGGPPASPTRWETDPAGVTREVGDDRT